MNQYIKIRDRKGERRMNLRQLQYFKTIAELEHYTRAAEKLYVSQSNLSHSIQELEDSVAYIDWKQSFYDEVLSGKRPYVSNLIPPEHP